MSNDTPSSDYVTDTMALVLHLESRRMGALAMGAFRGAEAGGCKLHVPGMVLAEVMYLSEKGRIELSVAELKTYLTVHAGIAVCPMGLDVVEAAHEIADIPELHDRLIAGSARSLGLPLITNDPVIEDSTFVDTVW